MIASGVLRIVVGAVVAWFVDLALDEARKALEIRVRRWMRRKFESLLDWLFGPPIPA
jgi:hypothetical protein